MSEEKSYAGAAFNALMEEETKESVVVMLLKTFDERRAERAAVRAEREAASAMLAALKGFASVFGGDAGLDAAMRYRLDDELIEARDAIAQAEAAGIKES